MNMPYTISQIREMQKSIHHFAETVPGEIPYVEIDGHECSEQESNFIAAAPAIIDQLLLEVEASRLWGKCGLQGLFEIEIRREERETLKKKIEEMIEEDKKFTEGVYGCKRLRDVLALFEE